ncbi:MAG: hypothetical protein GY909_10720 [Oligoflexia bacterium]|nr:hypothetical protein [Oligoflexia bacterium]
MNKILTIIVLSSLSLSTLSKDVFYMIRGNLFDRHSPIHKDAEDLYENFVRNYFPGAHFKNIHNHKWRTLCRDLEEIEKSTRIVNLVIVGHSWGAQTAVSLAHCMNKKGIRKKIDIFFAFDVVHKPLHKSATVLPENIEMAYNWYQRQDFWLKGLSNMRRRDGSYRGITEEHLIFAKDEKWLHDRVMYSKFADGTIFRIMTSFLQ